MTDGTPDLRATTWPSWAWVLFALQVATLLVAILPWLLMSTGMGRMGMMGGMMDMGDMREMREMMREMMPPR